jgi:hypothetical protein
MEVGSAPIQKEATLSTNEESLQLLAKKNLNYGCFTNGWFNAQVKIRVSSSTYLSLFPTSEPIKCLV